MIRFRLISLSGITFDDDVYEIIVPTTSGLIGVMEHHMPLISVASGGVVAIRRKAEDRDERLEYFAISGGVIEIGDNTFSLLVDEADIEKDRASAEAEQARILAHTMKDQVDDQISLEKAGAMIDRQAVRIKVAGLRRRTRR